MKLEGNEFSRRVRNGIFAFSMSLLCGLTSCAAQHPQKALAPTDKPTIARSEIWEVELMALSGQGFATSAVLSTNGLIPVMSDVTNWNPGRATLRFSCPKDSSIAVHRFCEAVREDGSLQVIRLSKLE